MDDRTTDQKATHGGPGSSGAGGGGATGHGGAGALLGHSSSGFDSGEAATRTHRTWDDDGAHLTPQTDQEREVDEHDDERPDRADEPDEFGGGTSADEFGPPDRPDAPGARSDRGT